MKRRKEKNILAKFCFCAGSALNTVSAAAVYRAMKPNYDQVGVWSEVELDIIRKYAAEEIMAASIESFTTV